MRLSLSVKAAGIVFLLGGFPAEVLAAPDPFDKLELRSTFSYKYPITALNISPDGKILASASIDGTIQLWDTVNGKCLRPLKQPDRDSPQLSPRQVNVVVFSPDGKMLATVGDDNAIRFLDVATGEPKSVLSRQPTRNLSFSPDGTRLAVDTFHVIDLKTEKQLPILDDFMRSHRRVTAANGYDARGQLLVACHVSLGKNDFGGTIMVWSAVEGKKPLTLKGHTTYILQLAFSRDARLLASADGDKTIRIWDLESGKAIAAIADVPDLSHALAFSPDGKVLACGGRPSADGINRDPGKVRVFRVSDGKLLATLEGYQGTINNIVFSPTGGFLATGDTEGTIKLWNIPSEWPGFKDK